MITKREPYKLKSIPSDKALYEKLKAELWLKYPRPSAYRSGLLVQAYKRAGGTYLGSGKGPLKRWFLEEWKNDRGEVGYTKPDDIYRPTKRITKRTPMTFSELDQKEILRAKQEKESTGRVKRFKSTTLEK